MNFAGVARSCARGVRGCTTDDQYIALTRAIEEALEAERERCAKILDDAAQDWNRIRDPGMANNARSYARKIRQCTSCDGKGEVADYVGLEMKCVGAECPDCKGTGAALSAGKSQA